MSFQEILNCKYAVYTRTFSSKIIFLGYVRVHLLYLFFSKLFEFEFKELIHDSATPPELRQCTSSIAYFMMMDMRPWAAIPLVLL
jgi:hypothetical protein